MTRWFLPICLGTWTLLAGCTGPGPVPPTQATAVERLKSPPREPNDRDSPVPAQSARETTEPDRVDATPQQTHEEDSSATEQQETGIAQVEGTAARLEQTIEPNAVETPEIEDVVTDVEETAPAEPNTVAIPEPSAPEDTQRAEPAEPNLPAPAEPDAVTESEPNEPPARATPATDLPSLTKAYAEILRDYVRRDGRVDYGSLDRRRLELKQLLTELDELNPNAYARWTQDDKLAFWINAYNLKMLEIIARNYPIQSSWWLRLTWPPSDIRHIPGIWTDYRFLVMDEQFTLSAVEQRYFHRTFDDPRVYLALTYASRSSPPLRPEPYTGAQLDQQLDEQVKAFLSSPDGLRIDRQKMTVSLSALFKPTWRGKEFVRRYGTDKKFKDRTPETRAVLNFIAGYLAREDAYFLEVENYTLDYINFDWRLNDTARGY